MLCASLNGLIGVVGKLVVRQEAQPRSWRIVDGCLTDAVKRAVGLVDAQSLEHLGVRAGDCEVDIDDLPGMIQLQGPWKREVICRFRVFISLHRREGTIGRDRKCFDAIGVTTIISHGAKQILPVDAHVLNVGGLEGRSRNLAQRSVCGSGKAKGLKWAAVDAVRGAGSDVDVGDRADELSLVAFSGSVSV